MVKKCLHQPLNSEHKKFEFMAQVLQFPICEITLEHVLRKLLPTNNRQCTLPFVNDVPLSTTCKNPDQILTNIKKAALAFYI